MLAKAQKWGNSLAVRIPKPIAEDSGLHEGDQLDIAVVEGTVVLTPQHPSHYRLDDLLQQITTDNLHGEVDFGPSVGHEEF